MRCLVALAVVVSCTLALDIVDTGRLSPIKPIAKLAVKGACKTNDDCTATQCCVDNSRWMIASKRDVISGGPPLKLDRWSMPTGGTCVDYIVEGGNCHYPGFTSCGCAPGTKCIYYPAELPKISIAGKRAMLFRPGTSTCDKQEE